MQTPTPARANRIPRATPTQPGLCRRLHLALTRRVLQRRLRRINAEAMALRHAMALDAAAMHAHRVQYLKSPVLQHRIQQDREHYEQLLRDMAVLVRQLRELGVVL